MPTSDELLPPLYIPQRVTLTSRMNEKLVLSKYIAVTVVVLPCGEPPATRNVRGANTCQIAVAQPQGRDTVVVMSVIDNLVKGAAGQAVQAMNVMLGQPEMAGLEGIALAP